MEKLYIRSLEDGSVYLAERRDVCLTDVRGYRCEQWGVEEPTTKADRIWVIDDEENPWEETFAGVFCTWDGIKIGWREAHDIWDRQQGLPGEEDFGTAAQEMDHVLAPPHYESCKEVLGVEVWDILDHFFGDRPHLWNAGKYLLRAGRKAGSPEEQDLGKAIQFIERRRNGLR